MSISDVLNAYKVENIGIKFDNSKFAEIPVPFITQLTGLKSAIRFFTIVKEINGGIVHFFDPEKQRWNTTSKDEFIERCSGVALLVEVGEDAGEKDYIKRQKEGKKEGVLDYLTALFIPAVFIIAGEGVK